MSDAVIIAGIAAVGSIAGACIAGYVAYRIAGIHKQLNSMRDQENQTNRDLGNKEGQLEEKEKQENKSQ